MSLKKRNINLIGCGVSGLTTAITLMQEGHTVTIYAEKLPEQTTSAKAAAIWFPYEVRPQEKANEWSKISFSKFLDFIDDKDTGVSLIELVVILEKEEDAWWKNALPAKYIRKAKAEELPHEYDLGYILQVPLIETQLYLEFLLLKYKALGGKIELGKITSLNQFSEESLLINCSGLGAAKLFSDQSVYPIKGQILKIEKMPNIPCITAEFNYDGEHQELAYIVPRKDCIVLGGTAVKGNYDLKPIPEVSEGIIARCKDIAPGLQDIKVKEVLVGLRPGRPEIRLEKVGNVIHNYGHGGGGFTVSWGCAEDILSLI